MANIENFQFSSLNLDFNGIQTELKDYFKTLDIEYSEGGNFDILIKALSYISMINSEYLVSAINNLYLGSSNNVESTYLLASQIGYTPRMRIPSRSRVNATFISDSITVTNFQVSTIDFIGKNNLLTYTANNVTFTKNSIGEYKADFIIEDKISKKIDYYGNNLVNQEITLPSTDISQDDIIIKSYISGNEYDWKKINNFSEVPDPNSRTYFISINKDNQVKIIFGNGVVGQKPQSSEKIVLTYYTTSGTDGDGESEFDVIRIKSNSSVDINNKSNYTFIKSPSFGAKDFETIGEIKNIAPKYFSSLGNSIIQHDYRVLESIAENYVAYSNLATVNYNNGNLLGTTYLALIPQDYRTINPEKVTNFYPYGTFPISEIKNLVAPIEDYNEISGYYNGWVYINLISPTYLYIDINPYIEIKNGKNIDIVSQEVFNSLIDYVTPDKTDSIFGFEKQYRDSGFFKIINQNDDVISSEIETSYKLLVNKDNILDKKLLKIPENFLQYNEKHLKNLITHNGYEYDYLLLQDKTIYCTDLKNGGIGRNPFIRNIISSDTLLENKVTKIFDLVFNSDGTVNKQDIVKLYINKKMVNVKIWSYKIDGTGDLNNNEIPLYYSTENLSDFSNEYLYNYNNEHDAYFVYFSYSGISYLVGEIITLIEPVTNYILKTVENNFAIQMLFEKLGISQLSNFDFFNYKFSKNISYNNNILSTNYDLLGNVIFNSDQTLIKNNMNLQISSRKKILTIKLLNTPEISQEDEFSYVLDEQNSEINVYDGTINILTLKYTDTSIEIINTNNYNVTRTQYKDNLFSVDKKTNSYEIYAHEIYDNTVLGDIDITGGIIHFNDNVIIYKDYTSNDSVDVTLETMLTELLYNETTNIFTMKLVSQDSIEGLTNINSSFNTDPMTFVIPNLNSVKELFV